jgi:hypothetical protein
VESTTIVSRQITMVDSACDPSYSATARVAGVISMTRPYRMASRSSRKKSMGESGASADRAA